MAKKNSKKSVPKPSGNEVGAWAFTIGFVFAIIAGFSDYMPNLGEKNLEFILLIIGILIGFLNVADSQVQPFLLAGVSLVIVSWAGGSVLSTVPVYHNILDALMAMFTPATVIVALRSLFVLSHR
ncbi:MAG: hypothetical protein ACQER9_01845 [Nanobdellota archaeon]